MSETIEGGAVDAEAKEMARRFRALMAERRFDEARAIQQQLWQRTPGLLPTRSLEVPLMGWRNGGWRPADPMRAQDPNGYLFVSGSARSGTTALGRLLNLHPRIAMFIELYDPSYGYLPEMFEPENIRALHAGGHIQPHERNQEMLARVASARFVGDKRPGFVRAHPLTLSHFAGLPVTIVHTARGIYDVAHSYIDRAVRGTWAASRDHRLAVDDLNLNNHEALALIDRLEPPHRIIPIRYETFWTSAANARGLFRHIGVAPGRAERDKVEKMFVSAADLRTKARPLTDEVRGYIDDNYDFAAEAELARRCLL
jgi:hypothetical protein